MFYYDFSFHKQNMKRFVMLLVTLAVANSFPLENEENAALKTEVMYYHKSFVCYHVYSVHDIYFHIWCNFQLRVRNNAGVSYFILTGLKKLLINFWPFISWCKLNQSKSNCGLNGNLVVESNQGLYRLWRRANTRNFSFTNSLWRSISIKPINHVISLTNAATQIL